ncbi:MAG TPA: hypothetical protein VJB82_02240 [Candidatus Peribacterales bacterium]|nr:hypothetical protein [Candidatus Peribacterales bacterium]
MDKVSSLLSRVLSKRGLKDEADASYIVHTANDWLKVNGAPENAIATMLKNGVLVISVPTAIAGQECYALNEDLLLALQKKFPSSRPIQIRIQRSKESVVA